jgi:hypothetical protein
MQKVPRNMSPNGDSKKQQDSSAPEQRLLLAAIGMESEFNVFVDEQQVRPEDVFGSPRAFVRQPLMHRRGTSYHLPTGGAIYFDTGVIEVATPVIEIDRGCAARCGRSLWEGICFTRQELDAWERRTGRSVRLGGFSSHYNISFETPADGDPARTVEKLALLLTYILPAPVMLLAANRRSTGIGVRPRGERIEVTADFTPSSSLMIATATLITGIVREVMRWPSFELDELDRHPGLPIIDRFRPVPHTSRKGWLARYSSYSENPFAADVDAPIWRTTQGDTLSLRDVAGRTTRYFWRSIKRVSDPFTYRLIGAVMRGRAPSLLDLDDRPPEYDNVGRLCGWSDIYPARHLSRSRYERVLMRAISGQKLHMNGRWYTPVAMDGWARVVFRRDDSGRRQSFPIDYLLRHLRAWERPTPGGARRP